MMAQGVAHEFRTSVATIRAWGCDGAKTSKHVLDWIAAHAHVPADVRVVITPTAVRFEDPAWEQFQPAELDGNFFAALERDLAESRAEFVERLNSEEPSEPAFEDAANATTERAIEDAMRAHRAAIEEGYFGV
jgi:hypothetical protein